MKPWADSSRGKPYSKDPIVVRFRDKYWMYYSLPPWGDGRANDGWIIGIATSDNLDDWTPVGQILPQQSYEAKGLCAPGALVHNDRVHLFYQTYGNGPKDALCHAVSSDGINFVRHAQNPILSSRGKWNNGRAIDADVIVANGPNGRELWCFFATRNPKGEIQLLTGARAPFDSSWTDEDWQPIGDNAGPLLKPELPWEQKCIEAPALFHRDGKYWMFYAGAYNNMPQQIGVAWSEDGTKWTRLSNEPFLPVGAPGSWNSSESGHPGVFVDETTGKTHLFFQGNNDRGKTWYLSRVEIEWRDGKPHLQI